MESYFTSEILRVQVAGWAWGSKETSSGRDVLRAGESKAGGWDGMELQENWIRGQTDRAGAVATGSSGVHTETSETKNGEL